MERDKALPCAGEPGDVQPTSEHLLPLFDVLEEGIAIHQDGRIVYANRAAAERLSLETPAELVGCKIVEVTTTDARTAGRMAGYQCAEYEASSDLNGHRKVRAGGCLFDAEAVAVEISWQGRPATVSIVHDIADQEPPSATLQESVVCYRQLIKHAPDAIIAVCQRTTIFANLAAAELLGASCAGDLIGQSPLALCHGDTRERVLRRIEEVERGDAAPTNLSGQLRRLDGQIIDADWTCIPFTQGEQPATYLLVRDITERLRTEAHNRYLANHDTLTGLPNRSRFLDQLKVKLADAKHHRGRVAIHFLDLDHFKHLNDSLGHAVGDRVLQAVALRLQDGLCDADAVGRLGGDEFAVMQTDIAASEDISALADRLIRTVTRECHVEGQRHYPSATIGIAVYPDDGEDVDELLRKADIALYHAKASGRNRSSFFTDELRIRVEERDRLLSDIGDAVAREEFLIYFQPMLSAADGRILGVETLLRWQHPARGLLPAEMFIDVLEYSPHAKILSEWVLRTACRQGQSWHEAHAARLRIAVNLSMNQIKQPDLVDTVTAILDETGFDPHWLELELTENVIVNTGVSEITETLKRLRAMGVQIALDDFGTGYSSLAFLKCFPIDRIKIDQSFVAGIETNAEDVAIIRAVLSLGRSLELGVTAEGVENQGALEFLKSEGCDELQGYYLARPMPARCIGDFFETHRRLGQDSVYFLSAHDSSGLRRAELEAKGS